MTPEVAPSKKARQWIARFARCSVQHISQRGVSHEAWHADQCFRRDNIRDGGIIVATAQWSQQPVIGGACTDLRTINTPCPGGCTGGPYHILDDEPIQNPNNREKVIETYLNVCMGGTQCELVYRYSIGSDPLCFPD